MYHDHFGLDEPPFKITPDTRLFYEGGKRGDILEALVYAITCGEGIVKVVGEVGSGKTMLSRMLEVRLSEQVDIVYLANPSITPADIPFAIGVELGLNIDTGIDRIRAVHLLQQELLARHAKGRQVVCFVEEAQSMPLETLEEIRLLSNLETHRAKLLQIVLFGQPELDRNLDEPSIRQLRERIVHSFNLDPLGALDVGSYISFRMRAVGYRGPEVFSKGALRLLSKASQGLIRRVNLLGDKALLSAFADNSHQVTEKHVRTAIRDSEFGRIQSKSGWGRYAAMAAAVVAALGSGVLLAKYVPYGGDTIVEPTAESKAQAEAQAQAQARPVAIEESPNTTSSSPTVTVRASNALREELRESGEASSPQAAVDLNDAPRVTDFAVAEAVEVEAVEKSAVELKAIDAAQAVAPNARDEVQMPQSAVAEVRESVDLGLQQHAAADSNAHKSASDTLTAKVEMSMSPSETESMVSAPPRAPKKPHSFPGKLVSANMMPQNPVEQSDSRRVLSSEAGAQVGGPAVGEMPLLTERLTATRDWLGSDGKGLYSIQLMLTRPVLASRLEKFLRRWQDDGDIGRVYIYLTRIGEQEWYGVLYDQFDSLESAQDALKKLPDSLLQHGPYVRNIRDISGVG